MQPSPLASIPPSAPAGKEPSSLEEEQLHKLLLRQNKSFVDVTLLIAHGPPSKPGWRPTLVAWMFWVRLNLLPLEFHCLFTPLSNPQVQKDFELNPETVFQAVNLLDRFVQKQKTPVEVLQPLGLVALRTSAKLREHYNVSLRLHPGYFQTICSIKDQNSLEIRLLSELDWDNLDPVTSFDIMSHVVGMCPPATRSTLLSRASSLLIAALPGMCALMCVLLWPGLTFPLLLHCPPFRP